MVGRLFLQKMKLTLQMMNLTLQTFKWAAGWT